MIDSPRKTVFMAVGDTYQDQNWIYTHTGVGQFVTWEQARAGSIPVQEYLRLQAVAQEVTEKLQRERDERIAHTTHVLRSLLTDRPDIVSAINDWRVAREWQCYSYEGGECCVGDLLHALQVKQES